jgi:hypothetical protein
MLFTSLTRVSHRPSGFLYGCLATAVLAAALGAAPGTNAWGDPVPGPTSSPVGSPAPADSPSPTASTAASPSGTSEGIAEPVVEQPRQVQWNMVRTSVRSSAPHWTLRACPTADAPAPTEIYAEGTEARTLDIPLVDKFDWALMDSPTERTFCAEAVSDDLAGHTSGTVRTTLDADIGVEVLPMTYDSYCPFEHYEQAIRAGTWNRARFKAVWGNEDAVEGATVEAQYRQPSGSGTWKSVGQLTSDASGFLYIGYRHDQNTDVRICRPDTGCSQLVAQEWSYPTIKTVYASSAASVPRGYRFPLFVTVLPRHVGTDVQVFERQVRGTTVTWVMRGRASTAANGKAVVKIQAGSRRGVRVFKVFSPRDDQAHGNVWGVVPQVRVTIR